LAKVNFENATSLMYVPYSLTYFYNWIDRLKRSKRFIKANEILSQGIEGNGNTVLLRFDVERDPQHCLEIGKELASRSVLATFYFHSREGVYDRDVMLELQKLGHEIGYHHECLDRAKGEPNLAKEIFLKDLQMFRDDGLEISTVCQHSEIGLPMNGYDSNADLFRKHPELLSEAELIGEIYIDLNLKWGEVYVPDTFKGMRVFSSKIKELESNDGFTGIVIHPHRWRKNPLRSTHESVKDLSSMMLRKYNSAD